MHIISPRLRKWERYFPVFLLLNYMRSSFIPIGILRLSQLHKYLDWDTASFNSQVI